MKKYTPYLTVSLWASLSFLSVEATPTVTLNNPCASTERVYCYIQQCTYTNGQTYTVPGDLQGVPYSEVKVNAKTVAPPAYLTNYPPLQLSQYANLTVESCQYKCSMPLHEAQCTLTVGDDTQAYLNLVAVPAHGLTLGHCEISAGGNSKDFSCISTENK